MIIEPSALGERDIAKAFKAYYQGPPTISAAFTPTIAAAEAALAGYRLEGYAKSRNHVDGNVSRLNPYVTWGVFTLRELQLALKPGAPPEDYRKFVSELGWKAYFRAAHLALGRRIYDSLEPYKYPTPPKAPALSEAVRRAQTGLSCIDSILAELYATGYLHNHKRLWFAAYLVHYAGVSWQAGEQLFYRYLLDGEPGPNALSWQWVASTFSAKPYFFNVANMRRYGHDGCQGSDFDASYQALNQRYFGGYGDGGYAARPKEQPHTVRGLAAALQQPLAARPLVVLHPERLSLRAQALAACPEAPVAVVLDGARLAREQPSFMRLYWLLKLAGDLVLRLREAGRSAQLLWLEQPEALLRLAGELGCNGLALPDSWHPETLALARRWAARLPVTTIGEAPFVDVDASLRSFSSFWRAAEPQVMGR